MCLLPPRLKCLLGTVDEMFARPETTTLERLKVGRGREGGIADPSMVSSTSQLVACHNVLLKRPPHWSGSWWRLAWVVTGETSLHTPDCGLRAGPKGTQRRDNGRACIVVGGWGHRAMKKGRKHVSSVRGKGCRLRAEGLGRESGRVTDAGCEVAAAVLGSELLPSIGLASRPGPHI